MGFGGDVPSDLLIIMPPPLIIGGALSDAFV